jgi:hypothetical protein
MVRMVENIQKPPTSGLTGFEEITPERLTHLERDRWPEFERELRVRRNRKAHFILSVWYGERPRWAWLIWQCRKWDEVERVLNRHNVDYRWKHQRAVLELEDAEIFRQS